MFSVPYNGVAGVHCYCYMYIKSNMIRCSLNNIDIQEIIYLLRHSLLLGIRI